MPTVLADFYVLIGIVTLAGGIIAAEELLGFIITRVARVAGAGKTVLRDIRVTLRIAAAVLIVSDALNIAGLSSLFTTLTISGVAAVAVSLALQNTLSNVISGILLLGDGLIRLNDDVEFGGMRGTVVRVALRNTWVRTLAGEIAVVSNTTLSGGPLVNHSATARLSKKFAIE